ncbi:hypothetical protein CRE_23615 [Caenorhabditis remanei]|uniref:Uncharacterized protein n=1 Tax=Caenorhabditis remanei TaxID=31234 RepID=E3MVV2_CAERE|nr:hypothetical protein CRE_23615 [Caenorhabditis remanei]
MQLRDKKFVNYVHDVKIRKPSTPPAVTPIQKPPVLKRTESDTPKNSAKKIPVVKRRATMEEETKHTINTRSKSKKSEEFQAAPTTRSRTRALSIPATPKTRSKSVAVPESSSKLKILKKREQEPSTRVSRSTRSQSRCPVPEPPTLKRRPTPMKSNEKKPSETEDVESEDSSESESDSESSSDDDSHVESKRRKRECVDYPELTMGDESFYPERAIQPICSRTPPEFYEMASLWSKLASEISEDMLCDYKFSLRDILTGRVSCLIPIKTMVPDLPDDMLPIHERLYNLICQSSGAYPFKNHEGTKLVSKHRLTDGNQIGAQIMLECLHYGVLPFDVPNEMTVLNQIRNYVRIGIKDMLQEIVDRLPEGRNTIKEEDIKGNLVLNLLS